MIRRYEEESMSARTEQRDGGTSREDRGRKPYRKPRIEDYGSIVELTGTGDGTVEDGGTGGFDFSGGSA